MRPWHKPLAGALFLLTLASVAGKFGLSLSECWTFSTLSDTWHEVLIGPGGGLAFAIVGLVILTKQPANRIGWLCSLGGLGLALGTILNDDTGCDLGSQISPPGLALAAWLGYVIVPALTTLPIFVFLPLWFPDGRFLTRRWRTFAVILLTLTALFTLAVAVTPDFRQDNGFGISYPLDNPIGLRRLPEWWRSVFPSALNLLTILGSLAAIASMILRFRRSRGDERQQMKLFAYWTVAAIAQLVLFELIAARLAPRLVGTPWHDPILLAYHLNLIVVFLGFPSIIGIAIFKYRLYDIDIIINRTLVYGGLSLGIVAVYVVVVGALGALFQAQGSILFALLATGLIAVLFQPVRERLQRGVNRLMFGERDDPYAALSRLGTQLQTADTPEAMLQSVVETIAATLKLPYAAIELVGTQGRLGGAATGRAVAETAELPLRYQKDLVGYLVVSPRSPGESFTERERRLLADMAAQTGAMAHSVRLTAALQRSREKLVLTREEERRRIRRDLHDGLGPTLASQTFTMDAILDLLETDPQEAARLVRGLKARNQETVAEIRRLVYELRPPALDELGLLGALEAHVAQLNNTQALQIRVTARPDPLPPLPAAVEAAAYRIALEGVTNVVRHAEARHCQVVLTVSEGAQAYLDIEINDDGVGLPAEYRAGVGLNSMRERAEELGGWLVADNLARGTQVTARLPLALPTGFAATNSKAVHIRQAVADDYPIVIKIIGEAAAWLQAKGIDQWPSPPNEHWQRRTAEAVSRGEYHLAYEGKKPVGTFQLTWDDAYWLDDGLAGYVHRLAIRDHKHDQGLGDVLLERAIALIRRQERRFIRLDVAAKNQRLRRYYESRGFVCRGQVEDHDYLGALYEKKL